MNNGSHVPSKGKSTYECGICLQAKRSNEFSKTQINKLLHDKIKVVKCIKCSSTDEHLSTSNSKRKAEDVENRATKKLKSKGCADPSMRFIAHPCNTPLITVARQFAKAQDLGYKIHLDKTVGWRTVVKMAVRGVLLENGEVSTSIGLFKPGSHEVVSCMDSPAHHPLINVALQLVETVRSSCGVHGYIEGFGADEGRIKDHQAYFKYVILVLDRALQKVQVSLVWNATAKAHAGADLLNKFIKELTCADTRRLPGQRVLHSLWVNYNPSSRYCNAITGRGEDAWRLCSGPRAIAEVLDLGIPIPPTLYFPPFVFRQANICAFSNIIKNIRSWISSMGGKHANMNSRSTAFVTAKQGAGDVAVKVSGVQGIRCVELYGGVGTIGLNCLDLLEFLSCSDENPHNRRCFEESCSTLPSELARRAIYDPRAAADVASNGGMRDFDLVLVDPPRKGLDAEVLQALLSDGDMLSAGQPATAGANVVGGGAGVAAATCGKKTYFQDPSALSTGTPGRSDGRRPHKRLICVSCGFKAFQRDAAVLLGGLGDGNATNMALSLPEKSVSKAGLASHPHPYAQSGRPLPLGGSLPSPSHWALVHMEGHVLFPGSDHIETLAIFDRVG